MGAGLEARSESDGTATGPTANAGNVTNYVGTASLLFVLVRKDQDAVHRGLEGPQGPDLAEPALNSVLTCLR